MPIQRRVLNLERARIPLNSLEPEFGVQRDKKTAQVKAQGPVLQRANPQIQGNLDADILVAELKLARREVGVEPIEAEDTKNKVRRFVDRIAPGLLFSTVAGSPLVLGCFAIEALATGTLGSVTLGAGARMVALGLAVVAAHFSGIVIALALSVAAKKQSSKSIF